MSHDIVLEIFCLSTNCLWFALAMWINHDWSKFCKNMNLRWFEIATGKESK